MYTVYRTTNLSSQKFYIGVHKTNRPNDEYLGSGVALILDIEKLGKENFRKVVLFDFGERHQAFEKEMELIASFRNDPLCYNVHDGGRGGNTRAYHKVGRRGAANPMFGHHWSPEERKAIGERARAAYQKLSPTEKVKRHKRSGAGQLGKPKSPLSVERMRKTKQERPGRRRFTTYELCDPAGNIHTLTGHKVLETFCKTQRLSIWSVDWILLENQVPTRGSCVGWTAKIAGHLLQKSPSAPQCSQVLVGGPSLGQSGV